STHRSSERGKPCPGSERKRSSHSHWFPVPAARRRGTGTRYLLARSGLSWPPRTGSYRASGSCPKAAAQRGGARLRWWGSFLRFGRLRLVFLGQRGLQRQPDTPLLAIDAQDGYLHFLTGLDYVADAVDTRRRQLRNVDQAFDGGLELDKSAVSLNPRHLAGH